MPQPSSEAFEDGLDLQIGLLEAYLPQDRMEWACYPFLPLKGTSQQEFRTFRTIVLENPYLRATLLPGLGGRIISLFDKRTGAEILSKKSMLEPQNGGRRGAYVREGVQLLLDGQERLNSLGNVASQIEHAQDEESDSAVWLAETFSGTGLSFHLRVSLPSEAAELRLEARIFNRWLRPQPYNGAVSIHLGDGEFDGTAFFSQARGIGIGLFSESQPFDGVCFGAGSLTIARFPGLKQLAPRQVDSWAIRLVPFSGLDGILGASRDAALSIVDGKLQVQATRQQLGCKLLMLTEEDQTLEAIVDLYPEHLLEIPLEGLRPIEFVLLDPAKKEILRVGTRTGSHGDFASNSRLHEAEPGARLISSTLTTRSDSADLMRATFDVSKRHLAFTILGMKGLAEGRHSDAAASFEQALNFNAEDPLLWWVKALDARLADEDNQAELLNAHYLAPLEPALRAESFLCQPISLDPDPNPLLVSLEENPEEFIEVACLLIEAGLFDQASRWLDEAIRHRDLPMLRYLTAYCLVAKTRLNAEASEQVRIAAKSPIAPPFPFRDVERTAIFALHAAFPDDKNLGTLIEFLRD